jgi:hypothetical protein
MIPMKSASLPIGSCSGTARVPEPGSHHADGTEEVRPHDVHLVDIGQTRHVVMVGLPPDCLGLRLDAAFGTKQRNRAIQNAQRTFHLHRKST